MKAALLLLIPSIACCGEQGNVEVCASVVQAVEWSKWEGSYSIKETVESFNAWAVRADAENSSLRFKWYVPAVMRAIESAYLTEDREAWRDYAMKDCLRLSNGQT